MKCKSAKKAAKCACKKATAPEAAIKETPAVKPARKCGRPAKKVVDTAVEVTFTYHAEKGKEVFVAGSFNAWNPADQKLTFKDGIYATTLKLERGSYEYKFVVDGTWSIDPENAAYVPNDQGTLNSVVEVK